MEFLRSVKTEVSYAKKIAGAGWQGIALAREQADGDIFTSAGRAVWMPTALGAGIGMLTRMGKGKTPFTVALGGLIGSVVGLSAGFAWGSRRFTGHAARNSTRLINAVLDARWLERNPIDYA